MITRLEIRGYKALVNASVPLSPFTLLIGPNGCGKSAVLEVMQLFQRDTTSRLESSQRSFESSSENWELVAHLGPPRHQPEQLRKSPAGLTSNLPLKSYAFGHE